MAYQVLALKYRPLIFEDVIAQDHITKTLARAVATGRIAHGYLFTGPRGTGKTTTARILAKALNCVEGPTPTPCNKCPICREITAGSSLDVLEIDAASNTGVDDVRTLRENIRYLPTTGKKRVYIIDEVHRLSGSAFDALLKTLEEPPEHAVFIFATTEPHKVPQTILSRTQRYDFRRVPTTAIADHLAKLAKLEKVEADPDALFLMARKAEGSVRDSMSLLDQMIAIAETKITAELTASTLGIVDRALFARLLEIIATGKTEPVFELVRDLFDSGAGIEEFVNDFIDYLRNLLVQKSASDPDTFLEVSSSEKDDLVRLSAFFTEADILRMIHILSEFLGELKKGYDERLFLEITLVRLARMESSITLQEVIERLNRLSGGQRPSANPSSGTLFGDIKPRQNTSQTKRSSSAPPSDVPPPDAPTSDLPDMSFDTGKPLNLPRVQMSWPKVLDAIRRRKQMLASMLSMGEVRAVENNKIFVVFRSSYETNKQVAEKPESKTLIEDILREFYKTTVRIEFELDATPAPEPPKRQVRREIEPVNADDILKNDPDLKKMLEQIDGEIIGRRKIEE